MCDLLSLPKTDFRIFTAVTYCSTYIYWPVKCVYLLVLGWNVFALRNAFVLWSRLDNVLEKFLRESRSY